MSYNMIVMKKIIYTSLLIFSIWSCSNNHPTNNSSTQKVIEYTFASPNSGVPFKITYTNQDEQYIAVTVQDSFRISFIPSRLPFHTSLQLETITTDISPLSWLGRIFVNGVISGYSQKNISFTGGTTYSSSLIEGTVN